MSDESDQVVQNAERQMSANAEHQMSDNAERQMTVLISEALNAGGRGRDDALLQAHAFSDLDSLSSAPMIFAVLCHLALISAEGRDFSLITANVNRHDFKSLQFPTSYRACLQQVCNEITGALIKSHGSMGFIRMTMDQVPLKMREVVQLITEGTFVEIKNLLPGDLEAIESYAKQCKEKASLVVKKFENNMDTLNELTNASQNAKGASEEAKQLAKLNIDINEEERLYLEQELEKHQQELEVIRNKIEKEEKEFKDELDKGGSMEMLIKSIMTKAADEFIPVLATAGGIAIVGSSLTNMESGMAGMTFLGKSAIDKGKLGSAQSKVKELLSSKAKDVAEEASKIQDTILQSLKTVFVPKDKKIDWLVMSNQNRVKRADMALDKKLTKLKKAEGKEGGEELLMVCEELDFLVKKLLDAKEGEVDESSLYENFEAIEKNLTTLGKAKLAVGNEQLFPSPSPGSMQSARDYITGSSECSISKAYIERMQLTLEMRKEQLRSTERKAEEKTKLAREKQRELRTTLHELEKFKKQESTATEVLKMIGKGLRALADLKQQWMQLMLYFQLMENLVHATLGPALESIVQVSNASKECCSDKDNENLSLCLRNRLYQKSLMASRTAAVVKFLAHSYETVGSKHLLPLAGEFQVMLAYDSERDLSEIKKKKAEITDHAKAAQGAIDDIIMEGHEKFKVDIQKRQEELDDILDKALDTLPQRPTLSMEEKQKISEVARETFKEAEEAKKKFNYEDTLE